MVANQHVGKNGPWRRHKDWILVGVVEWELLEWFEVEDHMGLKMVVRCWMKVWLMVVVDRRIDDME